MKTNETVNVSKNYILGTIGWLGGAFYTGNQPDMNFFDGVIWLWYVGRYIAAHFSLFHY